jgi:hypothetical protein
VTASIAGSAVLTASFDGGMLQANVKVQPGVVISEVSAENAALSMDEYVELYNPTAVDISLAGYKLQYHSSNTGFVYLDICTLGAGAHIAPFSYFLVGVNTYSRAEDAHSTWSSTSFSASIGTVRLGAPGIGTGNADPLSMDRVGWGTAAVDPEGMPVDITGLVWGSIERKARGSSTTLSMTAGNDRDAGNTIDTDSNTDDFVLRTLQDPQTVASPSEVPP